MGKRNWAADGIRLLVCVDSYRNGIPVGRFYRGHGEAEPFESLTQFLIKMEEEMEHRQNPQSYTTPRTFSALLRPVEDGIPPVAMRKGAEATFEIRILYRQHTSWQGTICWQDRQLEQNFRSVLELILLMDSAMRSEEGSGAA